MKGIVLFLMAYVIAGVLFPIGFIYSAITGRVSFFKIAISIDQLGNVVLAALLNDTLIKPYSTYKFGNEDDTISAILGINFINKSLTFAGILLCKILDLIDKNHCKKSANEFIFRNK